MVVIVRSPEQRHLAERLINTCFARRGYGEGHTIPSDAVTFLVLEGEEAVGTMSLVLNHPVATMTRLAVDKAGSGVNVLRALFDAAAEWREEHPGFTELSIEVHPHHRRFYERMGFRAGVATFNPEVVAPGVVMSIEPKEAGWR